MDLRPRRVLLALCLLVGILASGSFHANALGEPYIGLECSDKFESVIGTTDQNSDDKIYLVCFKSSNNESEFVWSKDNNKYPAITYTDKIAYGRDIEKDSGPCKTGPENSEFADDYPGTYCDQEYFFLKGKIKYVVWRNELYEDGIVKTAWVAPLEITTPEAPENVSAAEQATENAIENSTTIVVLATFAMAMTPAALNRIGSTQDSSSNNLPRGPSSGQGVPEYMEIKARRDEKLKVESSRRKFLRFLSNPAVTLAKYRFFENYLRISIEKISRFSPGVATIVRDGDYLRAVLGSLTFFIYPIAILTGVFSFVELHSRTQGTSPSASIPLLLPSLIGMSLMIAIGILDSLAGALAGATFAILTFFVHVWPMGSESDPKQIFATLISIFLITFTAPLFAGALRKFDGLHKDPGRNWNYAVDYLLSPLVTAWMVWKVLEVIADLSGSEFEDKHAPIKIAVFIWIVLIIRYLIEHYVARSWGDRLNEMIASDVAQSRVFFITGIALKSSWIWLLITSVGTFQGDPLGAPALIALFALPGLIKLMWPNPPEHLGLLNLRGAPKIAMLFLIGIGLTKLLENPRWLDHQALILELALVPLLFFSIIDVLTHEHTHTPRFFIDNKWGVRIYQAIGCGIYIFVAGYIFYTVFAPK
jgi:hypothetical protein